MPQRPRRPRLRLCFLALLLLVLAPAALDFGRRPVSAEPPETAVANALGPSHESALVVKVVQIAGAIRDGARSRIPWGPLVVLLGGLALLLGLQPTARPAPACCVCRSLRSPVLPAPSGPRAPPVARLT